MKCSYAAFGEQNKTDNDSKCQLVYKSQILRLNVHNMGDGTGEAGHRNICYYVDMEIIR